MKHSRLAEGQPETGSSLTQSEFLPIATVVVPATRGIEEMAKHLKTKSVGK